MDHGVPIVERKDLAQAIYASVEVGRRIPAEHHQAVAEILAYVCRLKERAVVA
jgi:flagellar biosynthetic protein FlhB